MLYGRKFLLQQEPTRRLKNLPKIPVLVETGEASSHAYYDGFTVRFLRQAGRRKREASEAFERGNSRELVPPVS